MAKESTSFEKKMQEWEKSMRKAGIKPISEERLKEIWPKDSVLIEPGNWQKRLESSKKLRRKQKLWQN